MADSASVINRFLLVLDKTGRAALVAAPEEDAAHPPPDAILEVETDPQNIGDARFVWILNQHLGQRNRHLTESSHPQRTIPRFYSSF
jgi:hypothetical protein